MDPTAAMQLRDIAGALRAKAEEGEFDCCHQFVQDSLASLPASLERIAGQMEAAIGLLMPAPKPLPNTLGRRIVVARRAREMTQAQLAAAVNVTRSAVAQWETDRAAPHYAHLCALSAVLSADLGPKLENRR